MVSYKPNNPGYFNQPGELCQQCRRLRSSGGCLALDIIDSPWGRCIAAPYPDDPGRQRQRALIGDMQADTDAAESYRCGAAGFCEAFRPASTSPAEERSPDEVRR